VNLIDVYIHEVIRRLPEKNRDDIALELRSTIEDMLPTNYSEEDVKSVLEEMGNPAVLANGYLDQPTYLIGPRYYDVYTSLLKMILPIAAAVAIIVAIAEYIIGFNGEEAIIHMVAGILGNGIVIVVEVVIQTFFWFTFVFAIIERVDKNKGDEPLSMALSKWTPEDLKSIPYIPEQKTIPKADVFFGLMWTAIWATLYFFANQIIGIYEGGIDGLTLVAPVFNQEVLLQYLILVVALIAYEIFLSLYKLIKNQWTKRMAILNAIHEIASVVIFSIILLAPNILNADFVNYVQRYGNLDRWIIPLVIVMFIIYGAISIIQGFRKAKTNIS